MALKAGYKGFKRVSGGLNYDNKTGELSSDAAAGVVANPEGAATVDLEKLGIGDVIYGMTKIKTLKYTGDAASGPSVKEITFNEKPLIILGIFGGINASDYRHFLTPFPWNFTFSLSFYKGPSTNYGPGPVELSYNGNKMTITGTDPSLGMNNKDVEYTVYYIPDTITTTTKKRR